MKGLEILLDAVFMISCSKRNIVIIEHLKIQIHYQPLLTEEKHQYMQIPNKKPHQLIQIFLKKQQEKDEDEDEYTIKLYKEYTIDIV